MESMFLAQLIGLYLLIVGVVVAVRRKSLMPAITELAQNKAIVVMFAFIELAAGLAILLVYPNITLDWMGIISLVGWMMVIEGILYISLPFKSMQKMIRSFNIPLWYVSGGIFSALLGGYLTAVGFGLI